MQISGKGVEIQKEEKEVGRRGIGVRRGDLMLFVCRYDEMVRLKDQEIADLKRQAPNPGGASSPSLKPNGISYPVENKRW